MSLYVSNDAGEILFPFTNMLSVEHKLQPLRLKKGIESPLED